MPYCRKANTAAAMRECVADIENGDVEDMQQFAALDRDEQEGLLSMARSAADLLELLPAGVLARAGVNLERLPRQEAIFDAEDEPTDLPIAA